MFTAGASSIFAHDLAPNEPKRAVPIVLVHGFPLDSRIWLDCAAELRRVTPNHRLIVPDLPGFGQSRSSAPFTMASLADDLVARTRSMGVERFVIAGLSMGGYVALTLAKRNPSVLAGVLMVDSKSTADDDAGKAGRNKMAADALASGSGGVAEAMMPKMLHADAYAARPDLVKALDIIMRSQSPETIANACHAMRDRDDFVPLLPTLKVPFGAIVGSGDVIAPVGPAAGMVASGGSLYVIEGAGHLAPFEKPAETARAIGAFLHQHDL
jgi:pimeloyl-ACP methyl ester carboxylesterase